ncbi:MAG TPA: RimK/LysX family protein [Candidatus Saccharimonadales bacterium]|nr:RimK/LysX family protein [Candidatus Saccharimonadales bacterium]
MNRPILGKSEKISFPEFGLTDVLAKVDTGAYTSSLDCEFVKEIEKDGKKVIEFVLLNTNRPGYTGKIFYSDEYLYTEIKSANGVQLRYMIVTDLVLHEKTYSIRISLNDRSKMIYPALIGRKLIALGDFLVDVKTGEGPTDDEETRGL